MSLICIFAYILAALQPPRCAARHHRVCLFDELTQFTGCADLFHLSTTIWPEVTWSICCFENNYTSYSRQTLMSEGRQCCESWRDAEFGDRTVCAVVDGSEIRDESGSESPSDMTCKVLVLVRQVILLCFCHTMTLPWTVWQTIHWPHAVQILIATTTDTRHHRPFAAHATMPEVHFVTVMYHATATTRLLLCACCLSLATFFGWHSRFYRLLFPVYL